MRHLRYSWDLLADDRPPVSLNQIVSPREILDLELRKLERTFPSFQQRLARVERRLFWYEDPTGNDWHPPVSILTADASVERVRRERREGSSETLWIFTDGSVDNMYCGAAAVSFQGTDPHYESFSERFIGQHSSTQAELVALDLGCRRAQELGGATCITIVSDSQAALMAIGQSQGGSQLAVTARHAIQALEHFTEELHIWWTPSHVDLAENELADEAAKAAVEGTTFDVF